MSIETAGFAHVNLNCSALARSKRFYEHALGLRALVHTDPAPQDCSAFGLSEPGQWDAWMLGHTEAGAGCALDLLEWLRPRPLPAPPRYALGFANLGFDVPDLDAARGRIQEGWGSAFVGPVVGAGYTFAGETKRSFATEDPDGQTLYVQEGERSRLAFVRVHCSETERSLAFYTDVLGLKVVAENPGRTTLALPAEASGFRVELFWFPAKADDRGGPGLPLPARAEANRLGLFRMAFLCPDVARAHAELRGLGVAGLSAPADIDLGPACPAPRCRALFFRDPDGACLELIEVPAAGSPSLPPPAHA